MGMPIRWEPGNRGETPDRAVGSPGHLGHLALFVSFSERRLSLLRVEVYEALATATGEIRVWLRLE